MVQSYIPLKQTDSRTLSNAYVCFSEECMKELCRLTKDHKDNWEPPTAKNLGIFASLKPYGTPYLYNLNDKTIIEENAKRLENSI